MFYSLKCFTSPRVKLFNNKIYGKKLNYYQIQQIIKPMTVKKECKREVGLTKECLRPIGHSFHEWIDDTRNHRANAKHYAAISLRNSFNTGLSVYLYLHMHTHTHTQHLKQSITKAP